MLSNELQFSSYVCCIHTYTYIVEKTLGSPLDCKETKPVHPKGNQPWMLLGRIDAEVEAPILWPPDAKSWLIGKDPDVGNYWGQEENGGMMVGWHHWLSGSEFEPTPGDSEGQRSLVCCSPWGCKESDAIEWLNSNKYMYDLLVSKEAVYQNIM